MDREVFTIAQLADRWSCSKSTIARHEKDGYLSRCSNVPGGIHYPLSEVVKCEVAEKKYSRLSPANHGVLIRKINALQKENNYLSKRLEMVKEALTCLIE